MSNVAATTSGSKPGLVFFHSTTSGKCRRTEGYISQVLQRRRNHETFKYYAVAQEKRPDLVEKFGITQMPTLVVVEDQNVRGRLETTRACKDIERFLSPWLQSAIRRDGRIGGRHASFAEAELCELVPVSGDRVSHRLLLTDDLVARG